MWYHTCMPRYKAHPRFTAGALLLFSRKSPGRKSFRHFHASEIKIAENQVYSRHELTGEVFSGFMSPGVIFFLLADPEYVSLKREVGSKTRNSNRRRRPTTHEKRWKLCILFKEKVFHMYLIKREFDEMLAKAVPRRLNKDYDNQPSPRD